MDIVTDEGIEAEIEYLLNRYADEDVADVLFLIHVLEHTILCNTISFTSHNIEIDKKDAMYC